MRLSKDPLKSATRFCARTGIRVSKWRDASNWVFCPISMQYVWRHHNIPIIKFNDWEAVKSLMKAWCSEKSDNISLSSIVNFVNGKVWFSHTQMIVSWTEHFSFMRGCQGVRTTTPTAFVDALLHNPKAAYSNLMWFGCYEILYVFIWTSLSDFFVWEITNSK